MVEVKDGKKILTTPVSAEDLADIHIGDIIYLNGDMTTCRDVAHRREFPTFDLQCDLGLSVKEIFCLYKLLTNSSFELFKLHLRIKHHGKPNAVSF